MAQVWYYGAPGPDLVWVFLAAHSCPHYEVFIISGEFDELWNNIHVTSKNTRPSSHHQFFLFSCLLYTQHDGHNLMGVFGSHPMSFACTCNSVTPTFQQSLNALPDIFSPKYQVAQWESALLWHFVHNLYILFTAVRYKSGVFSWSVGGRGAGSKSAHMVIPGPRSLSVVWGPSLGLGQIPKEGSVSQHTSEAPQLLPKHRRRRCRALLTLPAFNVKLCGIHVKLDWHLLWLIRLISE